MTISNFSQIFKFKTILIALGVFFIIFTILISAPTALANFIFILICYLARNPVKTIFNKITKNKFVLLVLSGVILGLLLEALWYYGLLFENKPQEWVSLADDFIRMSPVYFVLFVLLYFVIKKYPATQKQIFVYGGIMGYIFYFAMEGIRIKFSPLIILIFWEINNFFLNGFLIWMPFFISGNLVETHKRPVKEHIRIILLLLLIVVISIAFSLLYLDIIDYKVP